MFGDSPRIVHFNTGELGGLHLQRKESHSWTFRLQRTLRSTALRLPTTPIISLIQASNSPLQSDSFRNGHVTQFWPMRCKTSGKSLLPTRRVKDGLSSSSRSCHLIGMAGATILWPAQGQIQRQGWRTRRWKRPGSLRTSLSCGASQP